MVGEGTSMMIFMIDACIQLRGAPSIDEAPFTQTGPFDFVFAELAAEAPVPWMGAAWFVDCPT